MKRIVITLLLLLTLFSGAYGSIDKTTYYATGYDAKITQPELPLDPLAWGKPMELPDKKIAIPLTLVALFILGCGLIIADRR